MDARYAEIAEDYLAELRALMPDILDWWAARAGPDPEAPNDFEQRWPAGPVAHPRVLEVVRRHFIEIERINLENERPPPPPVDAGLEASWGEDPPPPVRDFARPIDLLCNDLARTAPDLYGVMAALVFIPVGEDPQGELDG